MAQNVLACIILRMDRSDHELSHGIRALRAAESGLADIKNPLVKCLLFPIGKEFLSLPTDKNLNFRLGERGGCWWRKIDIDIYIYIYIYIYNTN